jgi:hypothetical protein
MDTVAQMSKRRSGVGVTSWSVLLPIAGGQDAPMFNFRLRLSEGTCSKVDMWTAVAAMTASRGAVGICLLGDKLYAIGIMVNRVTLT